MTKTRKAARWRTPPEVVELFLGVYREDAQRLGIPLAFAIPPEWGGLPLVGGARDVAAARAFLQPEVVEAEIIERMRTRIYEFLAVAHSKASAKRSRRSSEAGVKSARNRVGASSAAREDVLQRAARLMAAGHEPHEVAGIIAQRTGRPRRTVDRYLQGQLKKKSRQQRR